MCAFIAGESMPSLMCGCSGIHPLQQHIRLGIDLFATACLIEEGLACHSLLEALGGSWQELRAACTKCKIPRKEQGREVSLETLRSKFRFQRLQVHFTSLLFPGYLPLRARELVLFGVLQQRCSGPCIHAKLYVCRQVAWKLR